MKPLILTQEAKDKALAMFKELLEKTTGGAELKISITPETLCQVQNVQKPTVFITTTAYIKMTTLIQSSDKELAWYGVATRVMHNYLIEDILVYPQTVTTTTVDADEVKCAKWFMELSDDVINNLKFQGHSHVTMTASPSGRDTENWQKFADLLKPGEFYILCIGNKRGEFYWNVYDTAVNVHFENKDITMCVIDDKGNSILDWAKENIDKYIVNETPKVSSIVGFLGDSHTPSNGVYKRESVTQQPAYTLSDNNSSVKPKDTTKASNTMRYKDALSYVPAAYKADVDYEPESDTYFTYVSGIPDFYYSNLFDCYTCQGNRYRALNPKQKNPVGRPKGKKENKTNEKGVKVNESK